MQKDRLLEQISRLSDEKNRLQQDKIDFDEEKQNHHVKIRDEFFYHILNLERDKSKLKDEKESLLEQVSILDTEKICLEQDKLNLDEEKLKNLERVRELKNENAGLIAKLQARQKEIASQEKTIEQQKKVNDILKCNLEEVRKIKPIFSTFKRFLGSSD